jgi:hypothetical protein
MYRGTFDLDEYYPHRAVQQNNVGALQKWLDTHRHVKLNNHNYYGFEPGF